MRQLTAREARLLLRYRKVTRLHDRFVLFKAAREASNALLDAVEATIPKENPTAHQLTYLQGLSKRKARNYRKLRGMDQLLRVTDALRAKTLDDLGIGGGV